MPISHSFVSSVADIGGPTYVQPTHWNANHSYPPVLVGRMGGGGSHGGWLSWTNMPSAITELTAMAAVATPQRFAYDFTNVSHVRLVTAIGTGGFASAAIGLQWQQIDANLGSWWGIASGGTSAAWCPIGSGFPASALAQGVKIGTWYPVNPSAVSAGWVNCRIVGFMGDGAQDPGFSHISVFVL